MNTRLLYSFVCAIFLSFSLASLSGCDQLKNQWKFIDSEHLEEEEVAKDDHSVGATLSGGFVKSPKERLKIRKQFLSEIYQQVYARKFTDKEAYVRWMNVLQQGASVEGVYRGLVLSREYAQMERGRTTAEALDLFASEMALLTLTRDGKDAKYLTSVEGVKKQSSIKQALVSKYETRSLFTLKRILGEEVLAYMEILKKDRSQLSQWYSETTLRWNSQGVDYGLEKRNSKDGNYHLRWAASNSLGRIQWEVLNRLHRMFNGVGRILYRK